MNETPVSSPRPLLIELGGEIDLRNAQALDDALCEAMDRTGAELLVDLSTVPFIDSCGLRMMVRVHQHAVARNCGVRWRGIQPAPARVVAVAGLDHVLHFERSLPTSSDQVHARSGMSTLDDADHAAEERDLAAAARDEAAERRDAAAAAQIAQNRISAAADRAASALDRKEAARARHGVEHQLRNAYRDDLTGVLSRDAGRDQLGHALDRAHRTGEPLVIAFVDVDHLKTVNDAHGHAHGDGLLQELGSALRQSLRSYDILVRYGGDEFVCALVGSLLAPAEIRFSDVSRTFSTTVPGASVSVGLAELREGESLDAVIDRADHGMYERRRASRAHRSPIRQVGRLGPRDRP